MEASILTFSLQAFTSSFFFFFFWILKEFFSPSKARFGYQEAKVYLLVLGMSFAYVTRVDLSMIKQLPKKQLVTPVACYLFLCFSSFTSPRTQWPLLRQEMQTCQRRSEWCEEGSCPVVGVSDFPHLQIIPPPKLFYTTLWLMSVCLGTVLHASCYLAYTQ